MLLLEGFVVFIGVKLRHCVYVLVIRRENSEGNQMERMHQFFPLKVVPSLKEQVLQI